MRRGTLAPIDPPRFVVRGGAYRIIRNPMYVANVAIVAGSAAIFRSPQLLAWAVGILLAFHVFVVAYEEPTLRRLFGEDYDSYRRDVGRWIHVAGITRRRDTSGRRRRWARVGASWVRHGATTRGIIRRSGAVGRLRARSAGAGW